MKRQVTGLLLSMLVHAALFCLAATFSKSSEYGVQAGLPQIEVDLVAAPEPAVQPLPPPESQPEPPKPEDMPAPEPPLIPARHEERTSSKGKDQLTMQSHVGEAIAAKPD